MWWTSDVYRIVVAYQDGGRLSRWVTGNGRGSGGLPNNLLGEEGALMYLLRNSTSGLSRTSIARWKSTNSSFADVTVAGKCQKSENLEVSIGDDGDGQRPTVRQYGNMVPIHKQGEDRGRPGSYGPVSLTSSTGKVMERLVVQYVMRVMDNRNWLEESQHGFRRGYLCETQLAGLLEDLVQVVGEGKQVDACFIHFEKAFERRVVEWIGDFLRGRRQRVKVGEAISEVEEVTSGVPQGSMLDPLLFTIMVNDMDLGIRGKIRLFGDNCVVYAEVGEEGRNLQEDIDKICFTRKKMISRDMYRWEGQEIEEAAEYKYLGIVLQGDVRWKKQIERVVAKGRRVLGEGIWHNVRPMLEYAAAVWDPRVELEVRELEKVQRKAGIWVKGRWRRQGQDGEEEGNYRPSVMMKEMEWSSLKDRRKVERGRGNNSEKLQRAWTRMEWVRQSMLVRSVTEWNVLREELVSVRGVGKFRKGVGKGVGWVKERWESSPPGGNRRRERWFTPKEKDNFEQEIPAEWEAWLRGRRKEPPQEEEVKRNLVMIEMKKEKAKKIAEREAALRDSSTLEKDVKGMESFPVHKEYEIMPGKPQDKSK
ncbi:hypothetical protein PR048_002374 [Dryococelus australis]|uniref:Reverse transcriptase domain-containing protein n=1 Tax=Dryococelus australis TaxID=614101 RepID=A0ABQ9IJZ9_9NEOP|nr:hypothetical protein PR048_002374 [Dryococelus australis]